MVVDEYWPQPRLEGVLGLDEKEACYMNRRGNISGRAAKSTASMPALREWFVLKTRTPRACPDLLPRPHELETGGWNRADCIGRGGFSV